MKRGVDDLWNIGVLPILAAARWPAFWDSTGTSYGLWRDRRDTPYHLRAGRYRLHLGVLIVAAGAALVLAFAPLDDLWHRMYGVDVTVWGPMHLVGLLGLAVGRFGGLVCAWIERRLTDDPPPRRLFGGLAVFFAATLLAGVVVTGEYEFMVPQFPMIFHPVLLTGLPVFPLVLIALLAMRPYAATVTALVFTAMRVVLAGWLMIASRLDWGGFSQPSIPMLIPTAIAVDLLVARRTPGWIAGVAAGAVTLAANLIMIDGITPEAGGIRLFWTAGMFLRALVPALLLSAIMGAAASATAASLGTASGEGDMAERDGDIPGRARAWLSLGVVPILAAALAGTVALAAAVAAQAAAKPSFPGPTRATAQIAIADGGTGRPSLVTIRVTPAAWWYYARFGPGQWGSVAGGVILVAGVPVTIDRAAVAFHGARRRPPEYVQPLGYIAFALMGAMALAGVTAVLVRMRRLSQGADARAAGSN